MILIEVNAFAVIACVILNVVIGSVWYSPLLFGKQWMELVGITEEKIAQAKDVKKSMAIAYGATIVGSLVLAYFIAFILKYLGTASASLGAETAFWLWLAFVPTTTISDYVFSGRPMKLFYINAGYYLVIFVLMGAILGYMG